VEELVLYHNTFITQELHIQGVVYIQG